MYVCSGEVLHGPLVYVCVWVCVCVCFVARAVGMPFHSMPILLSGECVCVCVYVCVCVCV